MVFLTKKKNKPFLSQQKITLYTHTSRTLKIYVYEYTI